MAIGYVLYNEKAGTKSDAENVQALKAMVKDPLEFINVTEITDYAAFLGKLNKDDYLIIAGGDGTLNRFVNNVEGIPYDGEILYYPNGTGNDFAKDLGQEKNAEPFSITKYLHDLPMVIVNDKKYRFINGIGYGIDGYCCEVGDQLKLKSDKPVNYTSIAIKGLLFHYKPTEATVTVDGVAHHYKKVWLVPTMHGRYYGGGMIPTPNQTRENKDTLSAMVYHNAGKLKALIAFPGIFKGEHVKRKKMVEILEGKKITVEFSRPTALQIDGETILGVTSYTAIAPSSVR